MQHLNRLFDLILHLLSSRCSIFLDCYNTVYPATGNGHTAVKLTLQELEAAAGAEGWVDVCKEPEGE